MSRIVWSINNSSDSDGSSNSSTYVDDDTHDDDNNDDDYNSILVDPSPRDLTVEESLSNELLKLSFHDRTEIEEEVHGAGCMAITETPELLESKLTEFNNELVDYIIQNKINKNNQKGNQSINIKDTKYPSTNQVGTKEQEQEQEHEDNNVLKNVILTNNASSDSDSSDKMQQQQQQQQQQKKQQDGCYVNDPKVRLRFLRCERFIVSSAVKRFVSFLELTKFLFGNFVSERPIRMSDFTKQESRILAQSRVSYMPFRDQAGRRVYTGVGNINYDLDIKLRLKIRMFLDWVLSEDIETQRQGEVIIAWPSHDIQHNNPNPTTTTTANSSEGTPRVDDVWGHYIRPSLSKRHALFQTCAFNSTPLRCASIHFCGENRNLYKVISSFFYFGLSPDNKSRFKSHWGTQIEIQYQLQAYGIPVNLLPLKYNGEVNTIYHSRWMKLLRNLESIQIQQKQQQQKKKQQQHTAAATAVIYTECPRSYDVLFRKGNAFADNHQGNVMYKNLIESNYDQYNQAKQLQEKIDITWKIIQQVETTNNNNSYNDFICHAPNEQKHGQNHEQQCEHQGGRFLAWDKPLKVWFQLNDKSVVREKVAGAFKRYQKHLKQKRSNQQQQQQQQQKQQFFSNVTNNTNSMMSTATSTTLSTHMMTTKSNAIALEVEVEVNNEAYLSPLSATYSLKRQKMTNNNDYNSNNIAINNEINNSSNGSNIFGIDSSCFWFGSDSGSGSDSGDIDTGCFGFNNGSDSGSDSGGGKYKGNVNGGNGLGPIMDT